MVTDIIGDEVEVLGLAASLEEASQHPLAEAVVKQASEAGLEIQTVENFQALHGKGVSGQINGKQVLLGNAKMLDGMDISSTYQEKLEELEKKLRQLSSWLLTMKSKACLLCKIFPRKMLDLPSVS